MATQTAIKRSFAGGEISPQLGARADTAQYAEGLKRCKNFIVQREGGVVNRPGLKLAGTVKDSSTATVLIPFVFEGADQTYMLEVGVGYIRWWFHGARVVVTGVSAWSGATAYVVGDLVVSGGTNYYCVADHTNQVPPNTSFWHALTSDIYEVPTPYTESDLPELQYVQSADVLTLTHKSYVPKDLQRVGHTTWRLVDVSTTPSISAPTNVAVQKGVNGVLEYRYIVTAGKSVTYEESLGSTPVVVANVHPPDPENPNIISWDAVSGAVEYYVHLDPYGNGIYGFIGTAADTSFNDVGFQPDFTITPPVEKLLFNATDDYPATATYYQQRRFFANTNNNPETIWGSQTGAFSNFSISTPIQDDDSIEFALASLTLNPVHHLVPLRRLLILSDAGEWVMRGDVDGAVTPVTLSAEQEGYVGADADIHPVLVGNSLLYVQARGTVLRVLSFETELAGLGGGDIAAGLDLTISASHLFDGFTIKDIAFAQQPNSTVWVCRSDGTLLGLTYLIQDKVIAWHQHTTGASGEFERCAVIPDTSAGEDIAYFIVKRTIDGATQRTVEYLASRQITTLATDAFFVDSGLSYTGSTIASISGLDHLEGEVLAILADGVVVYDGDPTGEQAEQFTVQGGKIELPFPATEVHAGLPIRHAEIETLELDVEGSAIRDRRKRVQSVTALVNDSARGFWAGPDTDNLLQYTPEQWEVNTAALVDGQLELNLTGSFTEKGQVVIRITDPLPFELLGVMPHLEAGA